jgi:hypothetical protein
MKTNFFSPLSFVEVFGFGFQDPRSGMGKKSGSGIGINTPDQQHRFFQQYRLK